MAFKLDDLPNNSNIKNKIEVNVFVSNIYIPKPLPYSQVIEIPIYRGITLKHILKSQYLLQFSIICGKLAAILDAVLNLQ